MSSNPEAAPYLAEAVTLREAAAAALKVAIIAALRECNGNVGRAALRLGIVRRTLDRMIVRLELRGWLSREYPLAVRMPLRSNSDRKRAAVKRAATIAKKAGAKGAHRALTSTSRQQGE